MKVKKIISIFVIALFIIVLSTTDSQASLELNNLDFNVQINEDGSMDVVETWNIYISETNTLYKTFNRDSSKYSRIQDFSVKEITDGKNKNFRPTNTWKYHIDENYYFGGINQDGKYEIAWGVGLDNSSDTRTYKISYKVIDAIKKYGDCAELYWQFIGDEFEVPSDKITGTIKLPNSVGDKEELKVWGHTEYLNGEIYVIDTNTIKFNLDNYKAGHFVEVRILTPTYIFQNLDYTSTSNKEQSIIEEETIWAEEANQRRENRDKTMKAIMIGITAFTALIGIVFINGIRKNKRILEENPKVKPEMELDYYRELPDETATPLEANFLLNKGMLDLSKTISASILDLTLKKYIKVEQINKTINMEILNKDDSDLPEDEKNVLDLLKKSKGESDTFTMKDVEKYIKKKPQEITNIQSRFEKISKKTAESKGKFSKATEKKSEVYMAKNVGYIFLIIVVAIAVIFGCAIAGEFATEMIKYALLAAGFAVVILVINIVLTSKIIGIFSGFTQKGINEKEQWKAFKKYMEDFSLLDEKEVPHLVLWEKYLVFATAFGIADKVIKQLKVKYPELNNQDTVSNMVLFAAMSNSNGLNTNFISSLNTSTMHMYSSAYSSGSGSGGGFSGGGGFGGRWRTVAEDAKTNKLQPTGQSDDFLNLVLKKG